MPTAILSTPIDSLSAYVAHIESLHKDTPGFRLFRGQGQDYDLRPSLARLRVPGGDIALAEEKMLAELDRRSRPFLSAPLENDWDRLALAQHHGLATRLLDWSDNALAALWFAVAEPWQERRDKNGALAPIGGNCAVVWIFRPPEDSFVRDKTASPFKGARTMVFQPALISPRIVAQGGWFTVHKYLPQKKNSFVSLQTNARYKPLLSRVTLAPQVLADLRRELRGCGIHHASIFPDIDGLCRDIGRAHSILPDEASP